MKDTNPGQSTVRVLTVTALVIAVTGLGLVRPSFACACGAMIPGEGELSVVEERAIVRWDGQAEDIVMQFDVRSETRRAAWILPTPTPATVSLGQHSWFAELDSVTDPRVVTRHVWWPREDGWFSWGDEGSGAEPPGSGQSQVRVLDSRDLGPFRVATLAATDSGALAGWLDRNGFRFPRTLERNLQPYVERNWTYVAVKLTPAEGRQLSGELQPLRIHFTSDHLVYPMLLSSAADDPLRIHLWVLAPHRVQRTDASTEAVPMRVEFAGWVSPGDLYGGSKLDAFLGGRLFLTEFAATVEHPAQITSDFVFGYTDKDRTYREIIYDYKVIQVFGLPAGPALLTGGIVIFAVVTALGFAFVAFRRRAAVS